MTYWIYLKLLENIVKVRTVKKYIECQLKEFALKADNIWFALKADTVSHLHVLDPDICATKCPDKLISKRGAWHYLSSSLEGN